MQWNQPDRVAPTVGSRRSAPALAGVSSCFGVVPTAFAYVGASVQLPHSYVSSPRPSNRTCRFTASGSHPGSCPSPTEGFARSVAAGAARSPALVRGAHVSPARPAVAAQPPARPPDRSRPHRSSRYRVPLGPRLPSLPHAAPSGLSGHLAEVLDSRHSPRPLPPSCAIPRPRPLRSTRITRFLHYYGPIRHPAGPSWPSRVPGWRVRPTGRVPRVAASFLFPAC